MEAALMAFAAQMQRKQYRYIGINGSNPLDIVFLISFLRSAVPNARLFSFESDLLLQHEPDNTAYIGTLSVTTYPLLHPPLNQFGEERRERREGLGTSLARLPFSSQREEGIYNATICTVRDMLHDGNLGDLSEREDCSDSNPPLWLTAFGAGGPWPIEALGEAPGPDLTRLPRPPLWIAVCILMCVHAILHVLVLLGVVAPFSAKFHGFRLGTVAPSRQLFGIHVASATLALALALVGLSAWTPNGWSSASKLLVWTLPVACWLLTFKYILWWQADRQADRNNTVEVCHFLARPLSPSGMTWQILAFAAIWIGTGILAYLWWSLLYDRGGHYGAFFSLRALNLASLVSPLAPMLPLLAAIYIAAILYVWHLVFNDKIRPRLNPSGEKSSGQNKLRPGWRSERFIAEAVNGDVQNAVIGGLILVIWILIFQPQFQQPQFELFERPQFRTLYEILFGLVILLILISGFRLARLWQKLRRFLLEINRQRARRVLLQLKGDGSSWPSIWFYGSEDPDWDYMVRSLDVLQELWNTPERPFISQKVDHAIKTIRRARRKLQDEGKRDCLPTRIAKRAFHRIWIAERDGKLENATSCAQDALASTLNEVLDRLLVIWGDSGATNEGSERQRLLEKYVALRWVAFIRAVIGRIRLSIIFLAISFSLAMVSLVVYSFEPHRELLWSVTALFIVIGSLTTTVLVQMHSDPVLSRITDTKPGRLDIAFYVHLVTLGIAPLLTLLATHFPSIPRNVVSWLQPGLEALK